MTERLIHSPKEWETKRPNRWSIRMDDTEWIRLNRMITKVDKAIPIWEHYQFLTHRRASPKRKALWKELEAEYDDYVNFLYYQISKSLTWAMLKYN